jgi:uncharacterized protein YbjT (DUF2867 family)
MKDALVTLVGGGGFLGRYVAQELLRRGARLRIVQRRPRDAWFLKSQGGLGQTQFVAADVTLTETIARAVEGSDAVVNLVGTFKAGDFHSIHVKGAQTVAQAAHRAGASAIVHVSALGADSDSPSGYGKSKAAGEKLVLQAASHATILRPSTLFGREDQFVNRFAAMIGGWPVVPVLAGATKFQPLWVADAAEALANALANPRKHGGNTYALGGPDIVSLAELNRWIAREIGREPAFMELPDALSGLVAMLPGGPLTSDQWRMLKVDNVVPTGAEGIAALGVVPTPLASVVPAWLVRFRKHGRFGSLGEAA